jgi:2-oxoglutarate ferredoxin oxidoreductase subunit delta
MTPETTADTSAVQPSGKTPRKPRPRGHVRIFTHWCKGCGLCIAFCPQDVFEANGLGRPVVANPDRCTACDLCAKRCPDMAIAVVRLGEDEAIELEELVELAGQGILPAGGEL